MAASGASTEQPLPPIPDSGAWRKAREVVTRLGHRRPGTSIAFVDGPTGEVILSIGLKADGRFLVYFHLYDSSGRMAAESGGVSPFPDGVRIDSGDGETLLDMRAELDADIQYRLYNRNGQLLTSSDGVCTRIEPCLRMEVWPRQGAASNSPKRQPAWLI